MDKSELIIKLLEDKMHKLDKKALEIPREKYDECCELTDQVTFLDELIDEIKRI